MLKDAIDDCRRKRDGQHPKSLVERSKAHSFQEYAAAPYILRQANNSAGLPDPACPVSLDKRDRFASKMHMMRRKAVTISTADIPEKCEPHKNSLHRLFGGMRREE